MRYFVFSLFLCAAAATAQELNPIVDTEQKPWTHLDAKNDPDDFQFVIVTDRTGGHRPGVFTEGVERINLMQPEFVMSVGDLIEGYTEDLDRLNAEWDEFNTFVAELEMPFFYVPGNHDITNQVMEDLWKERFGRTYYHFVYRGVLFLCLNSEDPPPSNVSQEQIDYVARVLGDHPDVRWTMVFIHKPLWMYSGNANGWSAIEELLQERKHTVLAGHTHSYYQDYRGGNEYIIMATMGGGSNLAGPNYGKFDHFMWVTMTDRGPVMANLMLHGVWDTKVNTRERREVSRSLQRGSAVRTDGIVIEGGMFERAETKLRLVNDADYPLDLEVRLLQDDVLQTDRRFVKRTLEPNSVEVLDLEVFATEPASVALLPPFKVAWDATYAIEGHVAPVQVQGTHRVIVDEPQSFVTLNGPLELDGELDEWPALIDPVSPGDVYSVTDAWYGSQDASMDFGVAVQGEWLYVAVDVTDDERRLRPDRVYHDQDSVELWIDPRREGERIGGRKQRDYLHIAVPATEGTELIHNRERLPEGVRAAGSRERFGYRQEFAVPLSYIESLVGPDWTELRINVAIHDYDTDGSARLLWRPEWGSPADYAGSGVFRR